MTLVGYEGLGRQVLKSLTNLQCHLEVSEGSKGLEPGFETVSEEGKALGLLG